VKDWPLMLDHLHLHTTTTYTKLNTLSETTPAVKLFKFILTQHCAAEVVRDRKKDKRENYLSEYMCMYIINYACELVYDYRLHQQ
jgi:hypothetical protein